MGENQHEVSPENLQQCRPYLRLLAATGLNRQLQAKLDPSDIVQQTLLQAHQARDAFRGTSSKELFAWLKQILTRNLIKAARNLGREKRDIKREQSLELTLQIRGSKSIMYLLRAAVRWAQGCKGTKNRLKCVKRSRNCLPRNGSPLNYTTSLVGRFLRLLKRGLKTLRPGLIREDGMSNEK